MLKKNIPYFIIVIIFNVVTSSTLCAGNRSHLIEWAAVCGQAEERPVVKRYDDLPRHTYKIPMKISEFFNHEKYMLYLAQEIKSDILSDLETYRIENDGLLTWLNFILFNIYLIEMKYELALKQLDKVIELSVDKESSSYWGIPTKALAEAHLEIRENSNANFNDSLKSILLNQLSELNWEDREGMVMGMAIQMLLACEASVITDNFQEMEKTQKEMDGFINLSTANELLDYWIGIHLLLPNKKTLSEIYSTFAKSNLQKSENIWLHRNTDFHQEDNLSTILVAVWDSGVDTDLFTDQLWRNQEEENDGVDNDGNGFIDDVHGMGHDSSGNPVKNLLRPSDKLNIPVVKMTSYFKGYMDTCELIDSVEADKLRSLLEQSTFEEYQSTLTDIIEYGHYTHGTHITSVVLEENPFIRLQVIRADYHSEEFIPTLEHAKKYAVAQNDTVQYFKENKVRIVNMSWSESRGVTKSYVTKNQPDLSEADADELAGQIMKIIGDSLYESIKNAPDILFVTSAGNNEGDVNVSEVIPSMFKLPNLVSVAAADHRGKLSYISNYGEGVEFLAEGTCVEGYAPGGVRIKGSGSSQACARFVNLAAKMLAMKPTLTPSQLINQIKNGSDRVEKPVTMYLINPKRTLSLLKGDPN